MHFADKNKLQSLAKRFGTPAALDISAAIDAHHVAIAMKAQGVDDKWVARAKQHRATCLRSARQHCIRLAA